MLTFGSRGYLGPIGDDIPSLIPILVGLITFFAAFTFTLNEYNARATSFSADRDTLIVANALKGDSYIATPNEFENACKGLRIRGLNYAAGIVESSEWEKIKKEAEDTGLPNLGVMANHFFAMQGKSLQCSAGIESPLTELGLSDIIQNRSFVVLSFPLAIQVDYAVVPATLVVMTWRI
ncbi:MAG: hypothetical protein V1776_04605 [Candidatus Diapherotrites archaeon]